MRVKVSHFNAFVKNTIAQYDFVAFYDKKIIIMDSITLKPQSFLSSPCHWVLVASWRSVDTGDKKRLLSKEELERCDRFRRDEDQQRYILAHALKRYCLSQYLDVPAGDLLFSSGAKGKPYCTHKDAPAFNLSHSGDYILLGLSSIGHVGVDVEQSDREVSSDIFPRVLSAEQQQRLMDSVDAQYEFMCYWTQKEAVSKALGLGLSIDFTTIQCSGVEGEFDTHHSKQSLLVNTRQWDERHIISVASTVTQPLQMIKLLSWDEVLEVVDIHNEPIET